MIADAELATMGDAALWAIALGFIAPLAISLIQQQRFSPKVKSVIAFFFYVVTGAVTAFFAGAFSGLGIMTSILLVFVMGATSYKSLWKPTGVSPAIESASTPGRYEATN